VPDFVQTALATTDRRNEKLQQKFENCSGYGAPCHCFAATYGRNILMTMTTKTSQKKWLQKDYAGDGQQDNAGRGQQLAESVNWET